MNADQAKGQPVTGDQINIFVTLSNRPGPSPSGWFFTASLARNTGLATRRHDTRPHTALVRNCHPAGKGLRPLAPHKEAEGPLDPRPSARPAAPAFRRAGLARGL